MFSAVVPVAVLYQAQLPPLIDGVRKPLKPGGYADSGADIAYALRQQGVTPVAAPEVAQHLDGVFPDTAAGIAQAHARVRLSCRAPAGALRRSPGD